MEPPETPGAPFGPGGPGGPGTVTAKDTEHICVTAAARPLILWGSKWTTAIYTYDTNEQ